MSKAKYRVIPGALAQITLTGEPVFVHAIDPEVEGAERLAVITRPVVTQNGIEYRSEQVALELLETRFEQAKRTVEFENFVQDLREEANNKRYALTPPQQAALLNNGQQQLPFNN